MYAPTVWVTGDVITAAKANNGETQYTEATDESRGTKTYAASVSYDLAVHRHWIMDKITGALTITAFSNPPATNKVGAFSLIFVCDGTQRIITWPSSVKWGGGVVPTPSTTNNYRDWYSFLTYDNGTTWVGSSIMNIPN